MFVSCHHDANATLPACNNFRIFDGKVENNWFMRYSHYLKFKKLGKALVYQNFWCLGLFLRNFELNGRRNFFSPGSKTFLSVCRSHEILNSFSWPCYSVGLTLWKAPNWKPCTWGTRIPLKPVRTCICSPQTNPIGILSLLPAWRQPFS